MKGLDQNQERKPINTWQLSVFPAAKLATRTPCCVVCGRNFSSDLGFAFKKIIVYGKAYKMRSLAMDNKHLKCVNASKLLTNCGHKQAVRNVICLYSVSPMDATGV